MPEAREAHGPSGPINQPSPRSGVSLGNGRGSGPGLTSSSAFGSVAQGPAGRVGHRPTRGPWNTADPQGQGYAAKAPWGDGADLSGAGRDQTGGWQSDPKPPAIRKNRQGACRLARPLLSVQWRCGVRQRPNPTVAPQRSSPAWAAHKITIDHDPKTSRWLGETGPGLLDQGEGDCRVRGADQLRWASLERGATDQRDGAGANT